MQWQQCPLCLGPLEVREVAPCSECGAIADELVHLREGRHKYQGLRVFDDLELTLCDLCLVDFSSYDPAYFGLEPGTRLGLGQMQVIRDVADPEVATDKFCVACGHSLAFLRFVATRRERHAPSTR